MLQSAIEEEVNCFLSEHATLFILKNGKRTHMGEVPGNFLCTVLTNGEPNKVTLNVKAVR